MQAFANFSINLAKKKKILSIYSQHFVADILKIVRHLFAVLHQTQNTAIKSLSFFLRFYHHLITLPPTCDVSAFACLHIYPIRAPFCANQCVMRF